MQASRTGRTLMAVLLATFAACSDDTTNPDSIMDFTATLNGASAKPSAISTAATGTATFTYTGTTIEYTLSVTGLEGGDASAAHVHIGAPNATGSPRLWLCGGGGAPSCPSGASWSVNDEADATFLMGVPMSDVATAMRSFRAYANVHTPSASHGAGAGEIRGNIVPVF